MKVRLSLRVEDSDSYEIRRAARLRGLSVTEWVRRSLRGALDRERDPKVRAKLAAIRRASKHSCPTGDIEQMLAEISSGYLLREISSKGE